MSFKLILISGFFRMSVLKKLCKLFNSFRVESLGLREYTSLEMIDIVKGPG